MGDGGYPDIYCSDINAAGGLENIVLYRMARDFPNHSDAREVRGKIIAIGRIYSASPERLAGVSKTGNEEAFDTLARALVQSNLDAHLSQAPHNLHFCAETLPQAVAIHRLTHSAFQSELKRTRTHPEGSKRAASGAAWTPSEMVSFVSKYLHFHRPNLFPIYDRLVRQALQSEVGRRTPRRDATDYEKFCWHWLRYADLKSNRTWTLRSIDTELTTIAKT